MHVNNLKNDPNRLTDCIKLIENSFKYSEEHSFSRDFNLLVDKSNHHNCYFVEENDQVLATVFTLPRVLAFNKSNSLPVLFIGGISVSPDCQGQGIFRSLFETVLSLNSDFGLYLLWSDLSSLYEKFDFYEFGLIEEVIGTSEVSELNNLSLEDFNNLKSKYEQLNKSCILPKRTDSEWELLWNNKSINKLCDSHRNVYFLDKGMDLQGIIHESYLHADKNLTSFPLWKFDPNEDSDQISRYMGFMRIGNIELLSKFVHEISNGEISISGRLDNNKLLNVFYLGDNYEMSDKDFIQGLWGPGRIEEWSSVIPSLVIFGFDSI